MKKFFIILMLLVANFIHGQDLRVAYAQPALTELDSIKIKNILEVNVGAKDHSIFKTTSAIGIAIIHKRFKRYYVLDQYLKITRIYDILPNGAIIDIEIK